MHVALIYGGESNEAEISKKSAGSVVSALSELNISFDKIELDPFIFQKLISNNYTHAFNACHGTFGEDGCLQGVLEIVKLPYTHSGVKASALAMDKTLSKKIFSNFDIRTPTSLNEIKVPCVVKPNAEGSSVGVKLLLEQGATCEVKEDDIIEEYISGRELACGVLNGKALPVFEITTEDGWFDYDNKYFNDNTKEFEVKDLPESVIKEIQEMSLKAHKAVNARTVSRSDIRLTADNVPYLLEINTHPGLTDMSILPKAAKAGGIEFKELVKTILEGASLDN